MTIKQLETRYRLAMRDYNRGYAKYRKMLADAMARHLKARRAQKNPDDWKTAKSKRLAKRYHKILYFPLITKKQKI
jgi:hypothetical protein